MTNDPKSETYTEAETAKRAAAKLKVMLATPHKPHAKQGRAETRPHRSQKQQDKQS